MAHYGEKFTLRLVRLLGFLFELLLFHQTPVYFVGPVAHKPLELALTHHQYANSPAPANFCKQECQNGERSNERACLPPGRPHAESKFLNLRSLSGVSIEGCDLKFIGARRQLR